jgi:hypothetical protein
MMNAVGIATIDSWLAAITPTVSLKSVGQRGPLSLFKRTRTAASSNEGCARRELICYESARDVPYLRLKGCSRPWASTSSGLPRIS